ncbi:MAG: hypothetical protein NTV51_22500 [Verrucomicrobia bacterium]|nr:hypothetical protein [Verrucomicrobiota bacterium]
MPTDRARTTNTGANRAIRATSHSANHAHRVRRRRVPPARTRLVRVVMTTVAGVMIAVDVAAVAFNHGPAAARHAAARAASASGR